MAIGANMSTGTKIAYADDTCNPTMGCESLCELFNVDPKKSKCYAAALTRRYAGQPGWPKDFTIPEYFPGRIEKALRQRSLVGEDRPGKPWLYGQPRTIFVGDMGDTFSTNLQWLVDSWGAMVASPHRYLFLTKVPDMMIGFLAITGGSAPQNMYFGVTVTHQRNLWRAERLAEAKREHIPNLKIWISFEPLCSEIAMDKHVLSYFDWLTVGGESGPHPDATKLVWIERILRDGRLLGIPVFFKQCGVVLARMLGITTSVNGDDILDPKLPDTLRVRQMPL